MSRIHFDKFFVLFLIFFSGLSIKVQGSPFDCLWGGRNEETAYTAPYVRGMGGVTLQQVASPPINLGAPDPRIPVQATPNTQAMTVAQSTLPTVGINNQTIGTVGSVGTVGLPATSPNALTLPQAPPGTEIMFVLPKEAPGEAECCDGSPGNPAIATEIVAPGTPGAIPVAVRTMTVTRPKVERHWTYSPIRNKTETLVEVVDPRTGRVVKTYCDVREQQSMLPWPHLKETVTYETVTEKVATPIRLPDGLVLNNTPRHPNPVATGTPAAFTPIQQPSHQPSARQTVNYPLWNSTPPASQESYQHFSNGAVNSSMTTIVIP